MQVGTLIFIFASIAFLTWPSIVFINSAVAEQNQENTEERSPIPNWIRNNAKWWSAGQIGDSDFAQGMKYLIQHDILVVHDKPQGGSEQNSEQIPSWVKNNAGWWAEGRVSDTDFISGLKYLIKINVIKLKVDYGMKLSSPAFENNGTIPQEYTCDGSDISPPLTISGVPSKAVSLVLVMDDPDAPRGTFTHWLAWNISPEKTQFVKGENLESPQGKTDFGSVGYGGPCPPSGTHRYFFKFYALNSMLELKNGSSRNDLEKAMSGKIIEQTTLIGKYSR